MRRRCSAAAPWRSRLNWHRPLRTVQSCTGYRAVLGLAPAVQRSSGPLLRRERVRYRHLQPTAKKCRCSAGDIGSRRLGCASMRPPPAHPTQSSVVPACWQEPYGVSRVSIDINYSMIRGTAHLRCRERPARHWLPVCTGKLADPFSLWIPAVVGAGPHCLDASGAWRAALSRHSLPNDGEHLPVP